MADYIASKMEKFNMFPLSKDSFRLFFYECTSVVNYCYETVHLVETNTKIVFV